MQSTSILTKNHLIVAIIAQFQSVVKVNGCLDLV